MAGGRKELYAHCIKQGTGIKCGYGLFYCNQKEMIRLSDFKDFYDLFWFCTQHLHNCLLLYDHLKEMCTFRKFEKIDKRIFHPLTGDNIHRRQWPYLQVTDAAIGLRLINLDY